jgi:ADP-ribose pyrophosphatase
VDPASFWNGSESGLKLTEKRLQSEYAFKGRILNLRVDTVELPNGQTSTREVVEYTGAVAVVALDGQGNVILVRQFRYPVGRELVEIPAGKIDPDEDPLECAKRELAEETGYRAREWTNLLRFFSTPGFTSEYMHLFLAQGLETGDQAPDEDEFVEVTKVPLSEAVGMVERGEICDAKSIVGLLLAQRVYAGLTTI